MAQLEAANYMYQIGSSRNICDGRSCKRFEAQCLEVGGDWLSQEEVQVDNTAGIIFQSKMNADSRIKGVFDLRWQWVKDLQDDSEIRAVKVDTKNNLADILTKCMSRPVYDSLLQQQKQKTEAVLNLAAAAA